MPEFGLPYQPRLYRCLNCGHEQKIGTNHTDICYSYCYNCSWKADGGDHPGVIMFGGWHRPFEFVAEIEDPKEESNA